MSNYTYAVEVRKTVVCKAGATVLAMLDDLQGKPLQAKIILGERLNTGKIGVYLEEPDKPENLVGMLETITPMHGAEELTDSDLAHIKVASNYQISLTGHDGNMISGMMSIDIDDSMETATEDDTRALEEAIAKKVLAGVMTKEEMDARITYMKNNHVDPYLMLRVVEGYRTYSRPARTPSCLYEDPYYKPGTESIISEGLRAAVSRQAVICEGEKSVGKNVYVETIAWLLAMPLYLITFSRSMSPSQIFGEKTTDNSAQEMLNSDDATRLAEAKLLVTSDSKKYANYFEDAAKFELLKARASSVNIIMDQSELFDALSDGGLLVYNEMNYADANMIASITNQMLDGTGFLNMPGRGEVPINPDTVLFATQNADYQGTEMQNEATMSRFGCILFPQPESIKNQLMAAVKTQLVKDGLKRQEDVYTKTEKLWFKEADSFYRQCVKAITNGDLTNAVLNIRGFVRAIVAVAESHGYSKLKRQIEIHVINTCPVDDRMALLATLESLVTT